MRLNLGCGDNRLPSPWQNHDADVDITKPLPWPNDSARFIVIEHCVEHVDYYDAIRFFKEAYRVLKIGGVLRVTVPSLTQVMNCGDQEYYDWLHARGWAPTADDRGAMHAMLYCHGHKTAWNAMLMEATLYYAGFNNPRKQVLGWSSHPDLCNVEGHHKVIGDKFNAIESITFEAAKMTGDLAKDYDAAFYAMHTPWREEYDNIARALADNLPPFRSALDLGCGNGYVIDSLAKTGVDAHGIDGSRNVLAHDSKIEIADITQPLELVQRDLVICTEVAEHVEERFADTLVDNVCFAARESVFFSAAQAGHGGHLHVNEQPRKYWIDKFTARGFDVDDRITERVVAILRVANKKTWWFAQNCFVLRRRQQHVQLDAIPMNSAKPELLSPPEWQRTETKVAIVLGGSERVWQDLVRAEQFCNENGLEPEYYATNDMVEHFSMPMVACTLHPDKLAGWLTRRAASGLPMPDEIWSHDGGSRATHKHVTRRLRDWGGSVGMFAYQVARERGHHHVILCGVPMTSEDHFVRKTKWGEVSAFTKSWERHREEMAPYVRSYSGGWTESLFGEPTPQWVGSYSKG